MDAKKEAEVSLKALDVPIVDVEKKSTRQKINQIVRAYSISSGIPYSEIWSNLYREFKYRYHIDLKMRSALRKIKPIEYAESTDYIEELYAVAYELFS